MQEILKVLERDARATPSQIAALTGLQEEDVIRRIAEWEQSELFAGIRR